MPVSAETTPKTPVIDRERFCVNWGGQTCELRNLKPFALFERLSRRPGIYISVRQLIEDVWRDSIVEPNTVQKTASKLQKALRNAGMNDLLIDGKKNPGHYALVLLR